MKTAIQTLPMCRTVAAGFLAVTVIAFLKSLVMLISRHRMSHLTTLSEESAMKDASPSV